MAHQSLYRVFRPQKFSDVSGQDHVTKILEKQIAKHSPGHAYLFCGSRGTGKTSTARILAKALNCLSPVDGNPCGQCAICKSFEQDGFVDVIEIDAASNNGVDNIRDIREKAALLPVQGAYKVYIIDEVHMLSQGAFNALLKTLEEPPEHTVFILATTEFRKIPKTIVSRCQHYNFRRISEEDITARLHYVAEQIGAKCEDEALAMLASQSDGAMRDALSMMDQCLAGRSELTKEDVRQTLGLSDQDLLTGLCDSIENGDAAGAMALYQQIQNMGTAPAHVLQDAIAELSMRLSRDAKDTNKARSLLRSVEVLIATHEPLRFSPVPNAVVSAAIVRAALPETDSGVENLAARVQRLEERMARAGSMPAAQTAPAVRAPQAAQTAPATRAPQPAEPAATSTQNAPQEMKQAANAERNDLARFAQAMRERGPAYVPLVRALSSLVRDGAVVVGKAAPSNLAVAQMLEQGIAAQDAAEVLEMIYGQPAPKLRIEAVKAPEQNEDQQVIETLYETFGKDHVTITKD